MTIGMVPQVEMTSERKEKWDNICESLAEAVEIGYDCYEFLDGCENTAEKIGILKQLKEEYALRVSGNYRDVDIKTIGGVNYLLSGALSWGDDLPKSAELFIKIERISELFDWLEQQARIDQIGDIAELSDAYGELASITPPPLPERTTGEMESTKLPSKDAYEKIEGNRAGEEKTLEIAPGVKMTFCWCPPGEFLMGSPDTEEDRSDDEDQVKVTLSKGFWMAKTVVTQKQWESVMGSNPSGFKGDDLPVETVSWDDAQIFLLKLNERLGNEDGGVMVLPSEAQWEYACRAGETGPYSGGTIDEVAWYDENSGEETHAVGTKKANAWGIHDMHGNVWEWCQDWYNTELSGGVDPKGAASGTIRVVRGGSWFNGAIYCRAALRSTGTPAGTRSGYGFRVARSSVP